MSQKNLIGIGTFGNINFTKMAVHSVQETVNNDYTIYLVVGKVGDLETIEFAESEGIPYKIHPSNLGFPRAVNDIYDAGWVDGDYDNVIIMGNDVVAYPYAIDSLIDTAEDSDYEWICSLQYDVRSLIKEFPKTKKFFSGASLIFDYFRGRPWEAFTSYSKEREIAEIGFSDVQNLCLYKRSVFEKIGYTDTNFYPAYFIDNDLARRGVNANLSACTLINSRYFHFWSRTIHQETGGTTPLAFNKNQAFYKTKWGGDFGQEAWTIPFNGGTYSLTDGVDLVGSLNIDSREQELDIINYWRK